MYSTILVGATVAFVLLAAYVVYQAFIAPRSNPLRNLCGPPVHGLSGDLGAILQ
jgi:hypothetical protein